MNEAIFWFSLLLYLFIWFETRQVLIGRSWPSKIKNSFFFFQVFFLNFYFIYFFMYVFVYTPSNQHFKAFLVSKFNSGTSFLYQLFKENSNFIVTEPCKVICKSIFFMIFIIIYIYSNLYLCIYTPSYPHFKAFPVSKFNFETSFL